MFLHKHPIMKCQYYLGARKLTRTTIYIKPKYNMNLTKNKTQVKHAIIRQAGLTVLNDFKNKVFQIKTGCKNTVEAYPIIFIVFRTVENVQDFISFV